MGLNLINIDVDKNAFKQFLEQLTKIPKGLKYLLIIVLAIGILYFGYNTFFRDTELVELKENVDTLKEKIDNSVYNDDYYNDFVSIATAMLSLQHMYYYSYKLEQEQLDVFKKFLQTTHPNSEIINSIDILKKQNEFMYNNTKKQFENSMKNCKYIQNEYSEENNNITILQNNKDNNDK